jgi:hypothetical protein
VRAVDGVHMNEQAGPNRYVRNYNKTVGAADVHACLHILFVFLGAFAKFRKATIASSCLYVCPSARNDSAPTGRIFMKFEFVFRNSAEKI